VTGQTRRRPPPLPPCTSACCATGAGRRTVGDRVRTTRWSAPTGDADACAEGTRPDERLVLRVGLWVEGGTVAAARFRATTCATLLALADAACEWAEGRPVAEVAAVAPPVLLALLPDVPEGRRDRASLVAAALRAAASCVPRPIQPPEQEGAP